jgi:methanogenic corrinoid protein MtbC1
MNEHERKELVAAIADMAGLEVEDLDEDTLIDTLIDLVHDAHSHAASLVTGEGTDSMLEYLRDNWL